MPINKFQFELKLEGHDKPAKDIPFEVRFPKRLKTMAEDDMIDWVRQQVRSGKDIYGNTFVPKADGTPATLILTGAMLEGIQPAMYADLSGNDAVAAVGISCNPSGNWDHYPWILNSGVNPDKARGKRLDRVQSKINRKEARLIRKEQQAAGLDPIKQYKTWDKLQETIEAIQGDLRELQSERAAIQAKLFVGIPPRPWWGLVDEKRQRLYAALQDWLSTLIQGSVAHACNPEQTSLQDVDQQAQDAFVRALKGQGGE